MAVDAIARLKPMIEENIINGRFIGPLAYMRDGIRYVGATDGHIAVFIESQEEAGSAPINFDSIFDKCKPGCANTFTVPMSALITFAGSPVFDRVGGNSKCAKCDGRGYCYHCDELCSDCDGSGMSEESNVIKAEKREGVLSNVSIDLNLLAKALSMVPISRNCEVTLPEDYKIGFGNSSPVFISGSDWRIILSPMVALVNTDGIPRLDLATAA